MKCQHVRRFQFPTWKLQRRGCSSTSKFVPVTFGGRTIDFKITSTPSLKSLMPDACSGGVDAATFGMLKDAYGKDVGQAGHNLSGHMVDDAVNRISGPNAASGTVCLTYGELLPGGVAKALRVLGLSSLKKEIPSGLVLELGMGTGMVALQTFLQCPSVSHVIGVEYSKPRFQLAIKALEQFTLRSPGFRLSVEGDGSRCLLEVSKVRPRVLEFRLGSFLSHDTISDEEFRKADAIFMQVVLPHKAMPAIEDRLLQVKDGCKLFSLPDLLSTWNSNQACPLRPWQGGSDRYAASWGTSEGVIFHTFVAQRNPSAITDGWCDEALTGRDA